MAAFENISVTEGKERDSKAWSKDHKGIRVQGKKETSPKKEAAEDSSGTQEKIRCYNCNKFGHFSKDCKQPKREKGTCFKCDMKGHTIGECTGKIEANQINCLQTETTSGDFQKRVTLKLNNSCMKCEVEIDALLDTGSSISFVKSKIIPDCFIDQSKVTNNYCGINGSKLNVIGSIVIDISCDETKEIGAHVYVVDDNTMFFSMVIGRDLLKRFKLCIVNEPCVVKELCVVNEPMSNEDKCGEEILSIDVVESINNVTDALVINPEISQDRQLEFRDIFEKEYVRAERPKEPKVDAELKLQLKDVQPFHFSPRRLAYVEKEQLQKIIDELLAKEVIKPSKSEYASPIVLVTKRTDEYRMCVDYRTLNKYIARTNYPIPVIEDQLNLLKDKRYFSMLDLRDGFYHIRMADESIKYTAFITPLGQFEYTKMPFGLKSAPGRFQQFINEVLSELIRVGDIIVYMDDILIATKSLEHHLIIAKKVFKLLVDNLLNLRLDKCKFMCTNIEYLGYSVSSESIRPTNSGIEAVSDSSEYA